MSRNVICLVSVVCVLGLLGSASADEFRWDNSSGDGLWRTPENWDRDRVPDTGDVLYVDWLSDPTDVIIDAETEARCEAVVVSNDDVSKQGYVHLRMTGGTLEAGDLIRIGRRELGMFTLEAGTVTCSAFQLGRKEPSKGVVYINGGTVTVATNTRVPRGGNEGSELHVNGGVLYTGGLVINDPDYGTNATVDITEGIIVLTREEDQTEQMQEYVKQGWLTAYGVTSGEVTEDGRQAFVQMDYDVTNPGVTTLWAVASDPTQARTPIPANGSTVTLPEATGMSWSAGDNAVRHDVYFGADEGAVANSDASDTTGLYRGRQEASRYVLPEALEWGATYYWRIDELEADGTLHSGSVWSFTVADYFVVDDFEAYNDLDPNDPNSNRIFYTWTDGWYDLANGSRVGHLDAPFAERTIVHGGEQSMPCLYDYTAPAEYSRVTRELVSLRDWTEQGVGVLSLWFRGYPAYVGGFVEDPAGVYTLRAAGTDIWEQSDEFHFAYKLLSGRGTIIAKVESVAPTHEWSKAGVMIRDTLDPNSAYAMMAVTPGNGVWFGRRADGGEACTSTAQAGITAPQWVKLELVVAGLVRAYYSADGDTWTFLGSEMLRIGAPMYIGLALTSHDPKAVCEAVFSEVSFPGTDVEPQWTDEDIGIGSNAPEPLYVTLANSDGAQATVVHPDPSATLIDTWTPWTINLASFSDEGVDLTAVDSLSIGFGDEASPDVEGDGVVFLDDLRLYRPAPEANAE